jgi:hypothetical protein
VNTKVGDVSTLNTTANTSAVVAINEVNGKVGTGSLATSASTIIPAINEVYGKVGDVSTIATILAQSNSAVEAINKLNSIVGDKSTLTTTNQASVVTGINEVNTKIGTLNIATGNYSSVTAAIQSVISRADDLSSADEVTGSPFSSYYDFKAGGPGDTISTGTSSYFAYVTFTQADTTSRPNGLITQTMIDADARWRTIEAGDTWRLDYSPNAISTAVGAWHLTSNMTEVIKAVLRDDDAATMLYQSGEVNMKVSDWLQAFRYNLKALLGKFSDEKLSVAAGGTGAATVINNEVFAGSATASGEAPSFRALETNDIPTTLRGTSFTGAITVPNKETAVNASSTGTAIATEKQLYDVANARYAKTDAIAISTISENLDKIPGPTSMTLVEWMQNISNKVDALIEKSKPKIVWTGGLYLTSQQISIPMANLAKIDRLDLYFTQMGESDAGGSYTNMGTSILVNQISTSLRQVNTNWSIIGGVVNIDSQIYLAGGILSYQNVSNNLIIKWVNKGWWSMSASPTWSNANAQNNGLSLVRITGW